MSFYGRQLSRYRHYGVYVTGEKDCEATDQILEDDPIQKIDR